MAKPDFISEKRRPETVSIDPIPGVGDLNPRDNPKLLHQSTVFTGPLGALLDVVNNLTRPITLWVKNVDRDGRIVAEHCRSVPPGGHLPCHTTAFERVELRLQAVFGGSINGRSHSEVERKVGLPNLREEIADVERIRTTG